MELHLSWPKLSRLVCSYKAKPSPTVLQMIHSKAAYNQVINIYNNYRPSVLNAKRRTFILRMNNTNGSTLLKFNHSYSFNWKKMVTRTLETKTYSSARRRRNKANYFFFFSSSKRRVKSSKSISSSSFLAPPLAPTPGKLSWGTDGKSGKSKSGAGFILRGDGFGFSLVWSKVIISNDKSKKVWILAIYL